MTEYTRCRNKNRGYMTLRVWQKPIEFGNKERKWHLGNPYL
jgi:hypothetical protein